MRTKITLGQLMLIPVSIVLIGCSDNAPRNDAAQKLDANAVLARLSAADQLDGNEDHVISKCYVCGLGMDGSPDHSVEFQGYTAHLCSEHCAEHFADSAEAVIGETEIPAPPTH